MAEVSSGDVSKSERDMAMLAHLLALAGLIIPFGNILGPLILMLVKGSESPFVGFHARQSLYFQIGVTVVVIALMLIGSITLVILIGFVFFLLIPVVGIGGLVYAIIGAVQVSKGADFEYYWFGELARKKA